MKQFDQPQGRRREVCRAGCVSAIAVVIACAAPRASALPLTNEARVREAETALMMARTSDDRASVMDLLADSYTGIDLFGQIHDRDLGTMSPTSQSVCESVHLHGSIAIVVAREDDARVLRVWVEQSARWRLAAEQRVLIRPGRTDPAASWTAGDVPDLPTLERTSTVRDVLRAQDALDRANAMRDPTTFARLTNADFVVITTHGLVRSKADRLIEERVARLESQPERPLPRRDDVRVRLFGSAAIVTARNWPRTFEGEPRPPTRYTRVWIETPTGWQQAANISTFVVPTAP